MSGSASEQASSSNNTQENKRFPANTKLGLEAHGQQRVLPFLNPNRRQYTVGQKEGYPSGAQWEWRSRENRKGLHLPPTPPCRGYVTAPCNSLECRVSDMLTIKFSLQVVTSSSSLPTKLPRAALAHPSSFNPSGAWSPSLPGGTSHGGLAFSSQ